MSKRSKQIEKVKSEWCSTREAAGMLDVTMRRVQQWAKAGEFGQRKGHGRRRISRAGVERFMRDGIVK